MKISVSLCETLPPQEALNPVLGDYYRLILERMAAIGVHVDEAAPKSALQEFWQNASLYLPPTGCLAVAKDAHGTIIGCGMLKRLDAHTGELKRLYVQPVARGTGTGRALVDIRVDAARRAGLKRLVVDTLTPNVEMRSLYPKLGFTESQVPIETTTYLDQPMLRPHMHYFFKDL